MGMSRWGKYFPRLAVVVLCACLQPQAERAYLRISVSPNNATILVGETKTLTATVMNLDGQPLSVPTAWWSSDNTVATVTRSGLLRGLGPGSTTIHASAEGAEAVADVQVSLMQLRPESPRILLRDTLRFSLLVVDPSGAIVQSPADVWLSSEPTVASVDSNGVVTGRATGTVSIIAVRDNKVVSVAVVVEPWTFVGAGDIADCTSPGPQATAALLDSAPGVVFTLGDNAYPNGTAQDFANCYAPTWGRHKSRTRPTPGNHDYKTTGAAGYFGYFGASAGDPSKGYYSFDLGSWHIIALNSVIAIGSGSAQIAWLQSDLAAHQAMCTLAYWHYSLFSSGQYAVPAMRTAWQVLYDAGADVVLSGHDHFYERFGPQSPAGQLDSARGIRQFVVGTGGDYQQPFLPAIPNSEVRNNQTWGILKLSLHENRYHWEFIPVAGRTFSDSGTTFCH